MTTSEKKRTPAGRSRRPRPSTIPAALLPAVVALKERLAAQKAKLEDDIATTTCDLGELAAQVLAGTTPEGSIAGRELARRLGVPKSRVLDAYAVIARWGRSDTMALMTSPVPGAYHFSLGHLAALARVADADVRGRLVEWACDNEASVSRLRRAVKVALGETVEAAEAASRQGTEQAGLSPVESVLSHLDGLSSAVPGLLGGLRDLRDEKQREIVTVRVRDAVAALFDVLEVVDDVFEEVPDVAFGDIMRVRRRTVSAHEETSDVIVLDDEAQAYTG